MVNIRIFTQFHAEVLENLISEKILSGQMVPNMSHMIQKNTFWNVKPFEVKGVQTSPFRPQCSITQCIWSTRVE